MELLPDEIAANIPPLYSQDSVKDPIAYVKLFTPDSNWSWYITEYDPEQRLAFGLVQGMVDELGYVSLDDLEEARGPLGLKVERDLYFKPTELSKVRKN